jgi:hypothetical protein
VLSERRDGRRNLKQKDGWITKKELRERRMDYLKKKGKGKGRWTTYRKKERKGKMDYLKKKGKAKERWTI